MFYKSQTISSGYLKCNHHETQPCTQTDTFLLNELAGQIFHYKNIRRYTLNSAPYRIANYIVGLLS